MSDEIHTGPCTHFILSRRKFLGGSAAALASIPLLGACEVAIIRDESLLEPVDPEIPFDLGGESTRGLMSVGGLGYVASGAAKIVLVRDDEDSVLAFNHTCPHQQYGIGPSPDNQIVGTWDAQARQLKCNWHSSVFGEDGDFVSGPANTPDIERYEVDFDAASGKGTVYLFGRPADMNTAET